MRQIFVNLKRFDVPVSMGGICPKEDTVAWTRDVIDAAVEAGLGPVSYTHLTLPTNAFV